MSFEIKRWLDAAVVPDMASGPGKSIEHRSCGCMWVADAVEGAIPRLIPCAACVLAGMIARTERPA